MKLITVPEVPPSQNQLLRMHWATRRRLNHEWYYRILSLGGKPKRGWPKGRIYVVITQHRKRFLDMDNLYASSKPLLDALVSLKWLQDDDPEHCMLRVEQYLARKRKPWTDIFLDPFPNGEKP